MHYVMSDIHGDYEKYIEMLEGIDFSEEDSLFVLGDIIDRGPHGIKILQDMMMCSYIYPILGNHEYMALQVLPWLMEDSEEMDGGKLKELMFWRGEGGETTIAEFHALDREEQDSILDYMSNFRSFIELECDGEEFVLVHAGLDGFSVNRSLETYDLEELIFNAPSYECVYYPDKYLVTGHTVTRIIHGDMEQKEDSCVNLFDFKDEVYMDNNHIAIDCACGYGGSLAAVCLETKEIFYV